MIDGVDIATHREADEGILEHGRALVADGDDDARETRALLRGKTTHVAEVEVDDAAVHDLDVAGMRIGVKEPMVENLRGVVVEQLLADFGQVISVVDEFLRITNRNAVDVLHDEHFLGAILRIWLETMEEGDIFVELGEFGEVLGLLVEVGFLEEGLPELLDNIAQVDDLIVLHEALRVLCQRTHHVDVLCHGDAHAWALDLDSDLFAAFAQDRTVYLCERGAAEWLGVDFGEDLLAPLLAVDGVKRGEHLVEGKWIDVHLEMRELLAIFGRENLGTRRERLPNLDEARAELLEHGTQLDGGDALEGMVAAHDAQQLAQARETGAARQSELLLRTDARRRVKDALEEVVAARWHV